MVEDPEAAAQVAVGTGSRDQAAKVPEEAEEHQVPLLAAGAWMEPHLSPLVAAEEQEEASGRRPRFHGERPQLPQPWVRLLASASQARRQDQRVWMALP